MIRVLSCAIKISLTFGLSTSSQAQLFIDPLFDLGRQIHREWIAGEMRSQQIGHMIVPGVTKQNPVTFYETHRTELAEAYKKAQNDTPENSETRAETHSKLSLFGLAAQLRKISFSIEEPLEQDTLTDPHGLEIHSSPVTGQFPELTKLPGTGITDTWLCPITGDLMADPVLAADGHTYEREAIEEWIRQCRNRHMEPKSPMTNQNLLHEILTPNYAIRSQIQNAAQSRDAGIGLSIPIPERSETIGIGSSIPIPERSETIAIGSSIPRNRDTSTSMSTTRDRDPSIDQSVSIRLARIEQSVNFLLERRLRQPTFRMTSHKTVDLSRLKNPPQEWSHFDLYISTTAKHVSQLEWEPDHTIPGDLDFYQAKSFIEDRNRMNNRRSWRIPDIWELGSLYQEMTEAEKESLEDCWFWSSTPVLGIDNARWVFNLKTGFIGHLPEKPSRDERNFPDAILFRVKEFFGVRSKSVSPTFSTSLKAVISRNPED